MHVIVETPAFEDVDDMYVKPCTPLIDSSSGFVTAASTVAASAPMYVLIMVTVGGVICGYSAIGNDGIDARPAIRISAAITPARIGRSTKMRNTTSGRLRAARPVFAPVVTPSNRFAIRLAAK